jgi:hypothetical protein
MEQEINGLYDDNGNKINPALIPVPGLCITCRIHNSSDWEDDVLCSLNRYDQRNSGDFKCGAYEKT